LDVDSSVAGESIRNRGGVWRATETPDIVPAQSRAWEARMRWTVVLVSETEKRQRVEQPLLSLVRDQQVVLEHLGLTLAEGKRLLQAVQQRMVTAQVKRHGAVYGRCGHCKRECPPRSTGAAASGPRSAKCASACGD
jgi:hypothetical protein